MPGAHFLSFDRFALQCLLDSEAKSACGDIMILEMCGWQKSLNFSSSNMESDDECDACAAVIVARCYDRSRRTAENPRANAQGGYMTADRLSVDAVNQASLMRVKEIR